MCTDLSNVCIYDRLTELVTFIINSEGYRLIPWIRAQLNSNLAIVIADE